MRKEYEALIAYLEKRSEWKEEYETNHDDAGSNYHFLVKESWNDRNIEQISERLSHLGISEHLHEDVANLVLDSNEWEMRPGSIFVPSYGDGVAIDSFQVGEIEDQICLSDLREENNGQFDTVFLKGMMLKARNDRRLCLRFDPITRNDGSVTDDAYLYINTDAVWYAVVTDETLKNFAVDAFKTQIFPEITELLKELKKDIADDYRVTDDPEDDEPGMQITISCSEKLDGWNYQTGDNSYTGGCYGSPYWGVGSLYRDSNPLHLAKELVADMIDQIDWE